MRRVQRKQEAFEKHPRVLRRKQHLRLGGRNSGEGGWGQERQGRNPQLRRTHRKEKQREEQREEKEETEEEKEEEEVEGKGFALHPPAVTEKEDKEEVAGHAAGEEEEVEGKGFALHPPAVTEKEDKEESKDGPMRACAPDPGARELAALARMFILV